MKNDDDVPICEICGEKQECVFSGFYDDWDGEPIHMDECQNIKCKEGCINLGGHFFPTPRGKTDKNKVKCLACGTLNDYVIKR